MPRAEHPPIAQTTEADPLQDTLPESVQTSPETPAPPAARRTLHRGEVLAQKPSRGREQQCPRSQACPTENFGKKREGSGKAVR